MFENKKLNDRLTELEITINRAVDFTHKSMDEAKRAAHDTQSYFYQQQRKDVDLLRGMVIDHNRSLEQLQKDVQRLEAFIEKLDLRVFDLTQPKDNK